MSEDTGFPAGICSKTNCHNCLLVCFAVKMLKAYDRLKQ